MSEFIWLDPLEARLFERWNAFTKNFPCGQRVRTAAFNILVSYYTQSHRHYHGLEHIAACLDRFDEVRPVLMRDRRAVEMALWWHDVIYNPRSGMHEGDSAHLAECFCVMMRCDEEFAVRIGAHIEHTSHQNRPDDPDARLVCDIDLAPLAHDPETFQADCEKIRREYTHIPTDIFRIRRAEIMRRFLKRPSIYLTEHFRERCEARARENIRRHIEELREPPTCLFP